MTNLTLFSAKDYIKDVACQVKKSQKRVFIMACVISDDPLTDELFTATKNAAKRGVETNIAADAFTFSRFGGYFSPFKRFKARSRAAAHLAGEFRRSDAAFRWLGGGYKFNPFAGVTHIKWVIVDDTIYCFGGVNLHQEAIGYIDYMFKMTNSRVADELAREQFEITQADMSWVRYDGFYKPLDWGTVYVDTGNRRDSGIYNRACELARDAKDIIFVSQYCPSGRLAEILKKKRAKLYFNQPSQAQFWTRLFISVAMFRHRLKSLYTRPTYLHAKFILFEMPGGQKIALTGSHNFSYTGVNFGTREVALETSDPDVYRQLKDFFRENIA